MRGEQFLNVKKFPTAKFVSDGFTENADGTATLTGQLSLHGITKTVSLEVTQIGHGGDPWGGFRRGFDGTTTIALKDFGINADLGPASTHVELHLGVEGIRQ